MNIVPHISCIFFTIIGSALGGVLLIVGFTVIAGLWYLLETRVDIWLTRIRYYQYRTWWRYTYDLAKDFSRVEDVFLRVRSKVAKAPEKYADEMLSFTRNELIDIQNILNCIESIVDTYQKETEE